jgi:hypothetical protein
MIFPACNQPKEARMDNQIRQQKIQQYGHAYDVVIEALHRCPPEMWSFKPSPDDWSIQEVIIHLADSEAYAYARCRHIIAEPGSHISAYHEEAWCKALNYAGQDAPEALRAFRSLRALTFALIRALPEAVWAQTALHPERGLITLDDWLDLYSAHAHDHLSQIESLYEAWKKHTA